MSSKAITDFSKSILQILQLIFLKAGRKGFGALLIIALECCRENDRKGGNFVTEGFDSWNKKDRLDAHVGLGRPNSAHIQAWKKCQDLMKQDQHVDVVLNKHFELMKREYRTRLSASVDYIRYLLRQGIAFRDHDDSNDSKNQGNFLKFLKFLAIGAAVGKNSPGDIFFTILVDESRDVSIKEQMIVVLYFVNKNGCIVERFIGICHVQDTSASSLKLSIDSLLAKHGLSISRIRGQGYDGASNMRGQFNGLKSLIIRENESAYYIHCFAHQLQLTLVAIERHNIHVGSLFNMMSNVVNVVGASCKRRDALRER
ncbi:uncharacterized protein LOC141692224 [Apium graveolens]|uniref:uncharacterized protein LOC141692224 n=1 Tax=Apium graveolens TaxID=4045 RepID=UPI003D7BDDD5